MQTISPNKIWPFVFLVLATRVEAQEAAQPANAPPALVVAMDIATEPEVTVDALVQRALANNPQLPIARQSQEAARQRLSAARAFRNPTLELVPRIIGTREAADSEVILSQPLDLFGQRRAQAGVAAAELRRVGAESTLIERSLIVQVKTAAADLFAAQEAEALGRVQVEVAQLFRNAAVRRAQLGDVPPVQVQRAELELLRVQNELTGALAERLARRAGLNQLIGQAPETPLRVALSIATVLTDVLRLRPIAQGTPTVQGTPALQRGAINPTPPGANSMAPQMPLLGGSSQIGSNLVGLSGQILPKALTSRPDWVGAQATLEARLAQVNVIRRQRLPDVALQARRSSFFGQSGTYALRAVVTLPVFDFGAFKGERRAVEAEVRAQESTIALLRSQIAVQVEQALIRLQQQRATVERYRTGIVPLTVDLLRKTQIGYDAGASTHLEVLEAQRTLRQVQTEYLQALVGTRTREAALEGALGATPSADLLGILSNPGGARTPPGVAAPGTVPESTIPPNTVEPLNPLGALPATPGNPANPTGVR